jgi:hypothetical protein
MQTLALKPSFFSLFLFSIADQGGGMEIYWESSSGCQGDSENFSSCPLSVGIEGKAEPEATVASTFPSPSELNQPPP